MSNEVRIRYHENYEHWAVEVKISTPACPRLGIVKPLDNWVSMSWFETEAEAELEKKRMEDYFETKDLLL